MSGLDWTIAIGLLTVGGPLLLWAINKVISERLMDFGEKLAVKLDTLQQGMRQHVDTQFSDLRIVVDELDKDMTKIAADMAVLAVRVKAIEDRDPPKRTR